MVDCVAQQLLLERSLVGRGLLLQMHSNRAELRAAVVVLNVS